MPSLPKNVVVVGGGTGSSQVLSGLKGRVSNLTALVSMADDGGSTGTLRDELGVLPPGDVRQCLLALSDAPDELRKLFGYRFTEGTLKGHSFGNLFLSAAEKTTHHFSGAVHIASDVLRVKGNVVPITFDNVRLKATLGDHTQVHGQDEMDRSQLRAAGVYPKLALEPQAHINPEAGAAIRAADLIVIAPGDVYTSIGPLLIVGGVAEALRDAAATIVYVCNLVTKPGHSDGFTVFDHAAEIERFADGPILDYVLYNTAAPDAELSSRYQRAGELPVAADERLASAHYQAIGKDVLAPGATEPDPSDVLAQKRSFIRHDGHAVADILLNLQ